MSTSAISEADILKRVLAPSKGGFAPQTAKDLLAISFDRATTVRIRTLLRKNNLGTISDGERDSLAKYIRVGQLIDLLQAKARNSLRAHKK